MADFLFYLFAALTLLAAFMVVVSRDPVNAVMFMILSFGGVAALFVLLQAYFLAVLQILVYAGAVIVLFLFVIMLMDIPASKRVKHRLPSVLGSGAGLLLLGLGALSLFQPENLPEPGTLLDSPPAAQSVNFGYVLFTKYMLPVQVAGFLLLVAMIGVVLVSKRRTPSKSLPVEAAPDPEQA